MDAIVDRMPLSKDYDCVGSPRCFGVELETDKCNNYHLIDNTFWGTHYDITCGGKEFVSSILNGNDGFDAIDKITDFAADNDWECGDSCGYHVHVDVSDESIDSLKAIALAYQTSYKLWAGCVQASRCTNSYCGSKEDSCNRIAQIKDSYDWASYTESNTRYSWVNWQAYGKHGTCEIRLHEGTCDGSLVRNWIKAHTVFVDWASRVGFNGVRAALWGRTDNEKHAKLCEIWEAAGCGDLVEFYGMMAYAF